MINRGELRRLRRLSKSPMKLYMPAKNKNEAEDIRESLTERGRGKVRVVKATDRYLIYVSR